MSNEKPMNITANKKTREFTINWDDGHVSVYPFGLFARLVPAPRAAADTRT